MYRGEDAFVWLPTGFGKSLCYTALPFLYDYKLGRQESSCVSFTLVISPLVSLITDQIVDLRSKGYDVSQFFMTCVFINFTHAQTVCTRPSLLAEGLGTRLHLTMHLMHPTYSVQYIGTYIPRVT